MDALPDNRRPNGQREGCRKGMRQPLVTRPKLCAPCLRHRHIQAIKEALLKLLGNGECPFKERSDIHEDERERCQIEHALQGINEGQPPSACCP
jgi:hypothetical protein